MIKMLIVDDHPVVLEGSKNLFKNVEDIDVDTTNDIQELYRLIQRVECPYDVFLIDLNIPGQNGIVISESIRRFQPSAFIILYTGDFIENYYSLILEKKIDGLLSKTATKEETLRTIRATVAGNILLPSNFIDYVYEYYIDSKKEKSIMLSAREKQILNFVSKGYTNSAIAAELQLTQRTIERNLSQIFNLLNVSTRTEAVIVAKEKNLI